MTANATPGPIIAYGQNPPINNYVPDYNSTPNPSIFYGGAGMVDMRWGYRPSNSPEILGFQSNTSIPTINATPSTASTSIIAAAQAPASGTALTLATQSSTGMTVLSTALTVYPSLNIVPAKSIALDGVPGIQTYQNTQFSTSTTGAVAFYDPTKALARAVRIQTNGADSTGSYLVSGYDLYGYPQTESLAGTATSTGSILLGKKAFKFVTSITPTGGINSTSVSAGTQDTFGFPLQAQSFGDVLISYIALITSSTGFTASSTITATSSTGDIRGTYALQTASNYSNVLQVFQTPRPVNLTSSTGLFGVPPA
jgi:hypothetical protein